MVYTSSSRSAVAAGQSIRVAVVDDEQLLCDCLGTLLAQTPGVACEIAATDHVSAVRRAEFSPPDVALLDAASTFSPSSFGLRLWQERLPQTALVLLDDEIRDVYLRQALRLRSAGYATKSDSLAELLDVIRATARGETAFSSSVRKRLVSTPRGWEMQASPHGPGVHVLTPRETEVLIYLAQGLSGKQCSEQLGISPSTVENHRARIMRKLKVRKTVELTRLALREGLMPR
jgi:DNA-binding NarL/FixJ family response regulator